MTFFQKPTKVLQHPVQSFVWHLMTSHSINTQFFLNTLRPRQDGHHFPDDIFKRIFFNEIIWTPIKISLKFVPSGPITNIPALVQIMAWRRSGHKPLSESMVVSLLTHICVTLPQWINHTNRKYTTNTWHHWPFCDDQIIFACQIW